ncbi:MULTISPECIES: hypothetical protein [Acinetobacter calcoaceticus/baumannii complex]|jgi:hypothetical protein|uniref:phage tail fiber protein n=1 Tax=Acinetobacter calcoaceticus/baumannii complex TaxID=909768 RepID=UPI0007350F66|nr:MULTISPECIES: hypothetical protein [Acinetobacter calcoaceticus/baumannii complex]OIG53549.1 hypothetical protein A7M54_03480 [Acinetobacter nosocomialis]OIG54584.1 hypothetical protein A7M62_13270 [Acinetobacter nosocomialis]OIH23891.1 hypothetical protein A7M95_16390 [Acinetobacter nosocomialis]PNN10578.1 hypothetical protein AL489_011750 [Acinetobacter sp. FDAARGOS_131]
MTIQTVNLGSAPTGAGGDTFRSTGAKMNENFTNNTHAASRYVGTAAGNVMEVGVFGLGSKALPAFPTDFNSQKTFNTGFYDTSVSSGVPDGQLVFLNRGYWVKGIVFPVSGAPQFLHGSYDSTAFQFYPLLISGLNTTTDSNGFIKAASPIVKLFSDKTELNSEAAEQPITFEKLDVGHYLIKGSSGFAKEGWWIEIPTDTHGNKICAVEYQTLENGDLEIKTFKKKLNEEGDIVANHEEPIDIPNNANGEPRWIDIRLNSIKKTIVRKVPRTEKQPRMVQQIKYSMQPTFMTRLTELIDDEGRVVMVDGKPFQKKETYLVTDSAGMATLTKQPVINENGEPVFEWVQAVDSEGKPIFDDVPVLDKDGNPIYDEVIHDPE